MISHTIEKPVLVLVGPTAIGKTALSLDLAVEHDCEIISMDSMQVYKYMDIGTAKVSKGEQAVVPHHLIDIVTPDQSYDAARFVEDAMRAITSIHEKDKIPLITGGTGLYLQALLSGIFDGAPADQKVRKKLRDEAELYGVHKLQEELSVCDRTSAERIHVNDTQRIIRALEIYRLTGITWSEHLEKQRSKQKKRSFQKILTIGLTCARDILYERINRRTEIMLESGLEQEVKELLQNGYGPDLKSMMSIGYKHMVQYLKNNWSFEEMATLLARDTRRYAKRQYTWFSKVEDLIWLEVEDQQKIKYHVTHWLSKSNHETSSFRQPE